MGLIGGGNVDIIKTQVGARIKLARLNKGMTLEEFGKLFGAGKSNVSKWEKGASLPNNERLLQISKFAGISVSELLYGSERNYVIQLIEKILKNFYYIEKIDSDTLHELYNRMHSISSLDEYSLTVISLYQLEKETIDSYIKADIILKNYDKFEIIQYSHLKIKTVIDDLRKDFMRGGGSGINKDFETYNLVKSILFDTLTKIGDISDDPIEIKFSEKNTDE